MADLIVFIPGFLHLLYQWKGSAQSPLAVTLHLLQLSIEGLQINHQEIVFAGRLFHFYGATQTGDRVLRVIHFLIDNGTIAFCPELVQFPCCRQAVDNRQYPFGISLSVSLQHQRVGMGIQKIEKRFHLGPLHMLCTMRLILLLCLLFPATTESEHNGYGGGQHQHLIKTYMSEHLHIVLSYFGCKYKQYS